MKWPVKTGFLLCLLLSLVSWPLSGESSLPVETMTEAELISEGKKILAEERMVISEEKRTIAEEKRILKKKEERLTRQEIALKKEEYNLKIERAELEIWRTSLMSWEKEQRKRKTADYWDGWFSGFSIGTVAGAVIIALAFNIAP